MGSGGVVDFEGAGGAEAKDPEDGAIGFENPHFFLLLLVQFIVGEQVAQQLASTHSKGHHAVAFPPTAQHYPLALQNRRIESHRGSAIHLSGAEWCIGDEPHLQIYRQLARIAEISGILYSINND